jgi:hypothetical protein
VEDVKSHVVQAMETEFVDSGSWISLEPEQVVVFGLELGVAAADLYGKSLVAPVGG